MVKRIRFKILLDEGLYPRQKLPKTNAFHNVRHIKLDFKYGGFSDSSVYKFALSQNRLIVTYNSKDFRTLLKSDKTGIIGISQYLKPNNLDKKLCSILNNYSRGKLYGHIVTITGESGKIKK